MNKKKLQAEMVLQGFTQADMAKMLGMTESNFNCKLNGKTEFKIKEAVAIAKFLHLEHPEEIFFDTSVPDMQRNQREATP